MEAHGTDIDTLERFVAENDELSALEGLLGRFNIFDALGIARAEIRHSNFLRWLLTPSESHGQGDLFLKPVLMDILRKARAQGKALPLSPVELEGIDLGAAVVSRESDHIDLLVVLDQPALVVAVENKIEAASTPSSLSATSRRSTNASPATANSSSS